MARTLEIKNSFVTGEISPFLLGRTDLTKYASALEMCDNFAIRLEGGITRRPGTKFVNTLPTAPGRLIPFIFSSSDSFVLAIVPNSITFGTSQIYFYKDGAPVLDTLSNPYFIDGPWNYLDNLELIKFAQVADTMYLVHPLYPPQKLNRLADNNWVLIQPNFHASPATQQDEDVSGGFIDFTGFGMNIPAPTTLATIATNNLTFIPSHLGGTIEEIGGPGVAVINALTGPYAFIGGVPHWSTAQVTITTSFSVNFFVNPGTWQINPLSGPTIQPVGTITITPAAPGPPVGNATIVFSQPVLLMGDVGKQIVAGTGIAVILSLAGGTAVDPTTGGTMYDTAVVDIIDEFDQGSYTAGSWLLRNGPGSYLAIGELTQQAVGPPPTYQWHGSNQFGSGSVVTARTLNKHPTDYSFQQVVGALYQHILYNEGAAVTDNGLTDTFRMSDIGRYIAFAGGYGQIQSVVSSTEATVLILSPPKNTESDAQGNLLIAVSFPSSWFFDDLAFTVANGYPAAVCFNQSRLWFAGTANNPQTIWGSVIGDFENFAKGTLDDDGIEVEIASGQFDQILWMQPYLGNIVIGTFRAEYVLGGGQAGVNLGQSSVAITPTNAAITSQSAYGVTPIQPLIIQESLFYVQRSQTRVYQMEFNIQNATYSSKDMTVLDSIITTTPIIEMVYQQGENKIVWFVASAPTLVNGTLLVGKNLIGLTFDKNEGVFAWHRHSSTNPDDLLLSIAVIPQIVNGAPVDQMWGMFLRSIDGQPLISMEIFDESLYLDCATHLIVNSPVSSVSGLGRFDGETVYANGDGALLPTAVMDSGGVYTLPPDFTASDIQVGLNFTSTALTVRPEYRGGTSQGIIRRWNKIWIRVYQSLGLIVNGQFIPNRTPEDNLGQAVPLFTGDEDITNLGYDRAGRISIVQNQPLPADVLCIFGQLLIGEN